MTLKQKTRIYVNKPSDVPSIAHYAVLEADSYYTPGDERSRTNPGHGYPAGTTEFVRYIAFIDETEFKSYVKDLMISNKPHVAVQVSRLEFKLKLDLE